MKHWASDLIGKPWAPGATGPNAFFCWGLLQFIFDLRFGVDMPRINIESDQNSGAIRVAAQASGWKRVDGQPAEDDIVVMNGVNGRHVGFMTRANGMLGVLHADGCMGTKGPQGSVVFHSLAEATSCGYSDYEFWRRA